MVSILSGHYVVRTGSQTQVRHLGRLGQVKTHEYVKLGIHVINYTPGALAPGGTKTTTREAKGIADTPVFHHSLILSSFHAPAYPPAKYHIIIEKVDKATKLSKYY